MRHIKDPAICVNHMEHPILMDEQNEVVMIKGFAGKVPEPVYLFRSFGRNYLDYGITDGSLLLCSGGSEPREGDLVVKMVGKTPTIYILRPGSKETSEGTMRVLGDPGEVFAVVISTFNFYY